MAHAMREVIHTLRRLLAELVAPRGFDVVSTAYTKAAENLFTCADKLVEEAHKYQRNQDNEYTVHRCICKLDSACVQYEAIADDLC